MTLGQYISFLETSLKTNPEDTLLPVGLGEPHSWRGAYEELAFQPVENITLGRMLAEAKSALNKTFQGYKGGDFLMEPSTPIHVDFYGRCSEDYQIWNLLLSALLPNSTPTATPSPTPKPMVHFSKAPHTAALELIDGAYDLVELYQPTSPYNIQWRQAWLTKARELGASPY